MDNVGYRPFIRNATFHTFVPNKPVEVSVSLPGSTWQRVTDVAVRVFSEKGEEPEFSTSMGQRKIRFWFRPENAGIYRCELWMGLTDVGDDDIYADVEFRIPLARPLKLKSDEDNLKTPLYPGVSRELSFATAGVPPSPGATAVLYGRIDFIRRDTGIQWHRVDLEILPD